MAEIPNFKGLKTSNTYTEERVQDFNNPQFDSKEIEEFLRFLNARTKEGIEKVDKNVQKSINQLDHDLPNIEVDRHMKTVNNYMAKQRKKPVEKSRLKKIVETFLKK